MEQINKQEILNAVANYSHADINYGECTTMGNIVNGHRQHIHKYYWAEIGGTRIQDNGEFKTLFSFAQAMQKQFAALEEELRNENVVYIRDKKDIVCGTDYVWHCDKYAELECVLGLVKIVPCAEFKELQEWLKKNAKFDLRLTDLYTCDVCQKRSSKSYSNFGYTATYPYECKRLLENLKAGYKSGNKVVAELVEFEDTDKDPYRYEYEQYGHKEIKLQVRISTPTGRNERLIA
jgi:hypothetical protein